MAVTNPSDLFIPEVAADYASQAFVQSLEPLSLIGAPGSGAPIELMNDPVFGVQGQYYQRPIFKRVGSTLVARRDITSNSTLTPVNLTGDNEIGVKLHRRIGPLDVSKDAARLSKATPEEISAQIGTQAGQEFALNMQFSVIKAILGMIAGSTTSHTVTVWNATARTNMSPDVLNQALQIMGDQREAFRRGAKLILRSESLNDLFTDAMGRAFTNVGDKALQGNLNTNTLGMEFKQADVSALTVADAGFDKYISLLLGAGAIQVWNILPMTFYPLFTILDQEQVLDRFRADCDFAIACHGAKWDSANGGANPTDTALALSTNWDTTYSQHQELKLVEVVHNYSAN